MESMWKIIDKYIGNYSVEKCGKLMWKVKNVGNESVEKKLDNNLVENLWKKLVWKNLWKNDW